VFQHGIRCQQVSRDGLRLRDQQTIERIAVMPGHARNRVAVACRDGQFGEAGLQRSISVASFSHPQ